MYSVWQKIEQIVNDCERCVNDAKMVTFSYQTYRFCGKEGAGMSDFFRWFHSGSRDSDADENKKKKPAPVVDGNTVREHIVFFGRVQGVGFRYRAVYTAQDLDLTGWVENEPDGTVTMEVQGRQEAIGQLLRSLSDGNWIEITDMERKEIPVVPGENRFRVRGY